MVVVIKVKVVNSALIVHKELFRPAHPPPRQCLKDQRLMTVTLIWLSVSTDPHQHLSRLWVSLNKLIHQLTFSSELLEETEC